MQKTTHDWPAMISAWRCSGKSGAEWCRENSIGYDQFQYWLKKLERTGQKEQSGKFVALKLPAKPLLLECGGAYLHVSSGFDPVLLREVVSALKVC